MPISPLLWSCFKHIWEEQRNKHIKTDLIFVVYYASKYKKISLGVINDTFNKLKEISNDEKWVDFSPQFVRNSLILKLFECGFSIDDIMYITGVPIENIKNYITTNQIIDRIKKRENKITFESIYGNVLKKSVFDS